MNFGSRLQHRIALVLATLTAGVGCKDEPERVAVSSNGSGSLREFVVPGTRVAPLDDDPSGDGWDSEARGAEVSAAMKGFGEALQAGEGLAAKLLELADPAFEEAAIFPERRVE